MSEEKPWIEATPDTMQRYVYLIELFEDILITAKMG